MTETAPHDLPAGEWAGRPVSLTDVHPPLTAAEDLAAAAVVSALPFLELPAGPVAPFFDGTQVCAQVDPEVFFPPKGASPAKAKALCGSCEFLNPCRRYALTAWVAGYPVNGVWGGTSFTDRARLRRSVVAGALVDVDEDVAS